MLGWIQRVFRKGSPASSTPPELPVAPSTAVPESTASASGDAAPDVIEESAEATAWKPKAPIFTAAQRADVVACDPAAVASLASTIISELLASIDKVPPFPVVANKLIVLSSEGEVRTDVVEELVSRDAVIAAKVIRAANAPYRGIKNKIETIDHAIRTIGLREVSQVAIAAAAAAIFDTQERVAFEAVVDLQQIAWKHSVATSRGAAWLANAIGADPQRASIAGLLHDIGKPVALRGIGFALINGRIMEQPSSAMALAAVEQSHTDVGAMLADAWSIGDELGSIVEGHHGDDTSQLAEIVQLTSAVDEIRTNPARRDDAYETVIALAQKFGLRSDQLTALADEIDRARAAEV